MENILKRVLDHSSNFNPFNEFSSAFEIGGDNFDQIVNSFIYYNCNNKETGKYPVFYIINN